MVPHKANHRKNYIPGKAVTMADFMLSPRGHYNGDVRMASLAALDHSRDYSEGSEKNDFWYRVYCRLEYTSLNLITIDKIGG